MLYLFALTKQHKSFRSFNLSLLSIKLAVHKKINVYAKPSLPCKLHEDCKCCSEQKGDKLLKASGHLTNWIPNELRWSSLLSPPLISGPLGACKSFRSMRASPLRSAVLTGGVWWEHNRQQKTCFCSQLVLLLLPPGRVTNRNLWGPAQSTHACTGTHVHGHTRPAYKCFRGEAEKGKMRSRSTVPE